MATSCHNVKRLVTGLLAGCVERLETTLLSWLFEVNKYRRNDQGRQRYDRCSKEKIIQWIIQLVVSVCGFITTRLKIKESLVMFSIVRANRSSKKPYYPWPRELAGSGAEDAHHQVFFWRPKFCPQNPHSRRRKLAPTNCPVTFTSVCTHTIIN